MTILSKPPYTLWSEVKKKTKVSVLEEKEEEKNPRSQKNRNIKNAIALLSKQNNHSPNSPFPKGKRKKNMILSLCNKQNWISLHTLAGRGTSLWATRDMAGNEKSRNKKGTVWEKQGKKEQQDPAVKPALPSPSTLYNVCILPPFVRDMNSSQTGGQK
jgi:hypothetical protein